MAFSGLRRLSVLFCAAVFAGLTAPPLAHAQSGDQKPAEQQKNQTGSGDNAKGDATQQRKVDEIAEAGRLVSGPAGNPECVWLGRRVVGLLWKDDLDTAFRHLDLYDRFGCPGNHVQASFRCVVRQGEIDLKAPEKVEARVHSCWVNPTLTPPAATASGAPPTPPAR